jgi:Sulfotransferase family
VFVLGSPRSGTTLLYDMLLSAGGFAVYLAESNVFNLLVPRFGDFSVRQQRQKLLRAWLNSKLFRATGLDSCEMEKRILEECRTSGAFLSIVMDEMVREQGMQRWAENSPEAILHLPLIKQQIPNALVIHIIRDGRDVAMSLGAVRYVRPFPWEERQSLLGAGIYWEWIVQRGRKYGRLLGLDYMEIHFEDLISSPQETLNKVGQFIDHELDYKRIRHVAYGSVSKPNTSFTREASKDGFNPVGRWKTGLSPQQSLRLERTLGKTLRELGYIPSVGRSEQDMNLEMYATRLIYRTYFDAKLSFKQSPLSRALRSELSAAEIDATVQVEDHPPEVRAVFSEPPR